jgi:hypothetical protein
MFIQEHNCETNEVIVRELNTEEIAERKTRQAGWAAEQLAVEAKATAKAALLTQLGITAEQAKLLLS